MEQTNHVENEHSESSWLTQNEPQVTSLQPLRNLSHEADSFFDFDIEPESPGSPIDECEYSRLIETTTTTPQPNDVAPESGYVCASPISAEGSVESQSSSDGPYFDPESSDADQKSLGSDFYDCIEALKKENSPSSAIYTGTESHNHNSPKAMANGYLHPIMDSDLDSTGSESLPPSQTTTTSETTPTTTTTKSSDSNSTITGLSSVSNSTLQDETEPESDLLEPKEDDIPSINELESQCKEQAEHICIALNNLEQVAIDRESRISEEEAEVELEDELTIGKHIQANGHLPNGNSPFNNNHEEDENDCEEVNHTTEEEIELSNEKIILECLHIIDATPEASPEPEVRTAVDEPQSPGHLKVEENEVDTDGDNERPQRVRRCSSLKTGKTPPGTPGRKKIVRFADVLGLDLADVRTFMDDVPKIPKSAFDDLELPQEPQSMSLGPRVEKVLVPLFQQPGSLGGFLDMVRDRQVCLENAAVTDPISLTITGSVRVRNLDFHKSVYLRYTTDSWRSYADLHGNYVENSCDGFSDKYTFILYGNALQVGQRIELAVRFHCKGQIFWDNNYGTNYCFQCLPVSLPVRPARPPETNNAVEDTWAGASFY